MILNDSAKKSNEEYCGRVDSCCRLVIGSDTGWEFSGALALCYG